MVTRYTTSGLKKIAHHSYILNKKTVNPYAFKVDHVLAGSVVARGLEIKKELEEGKKKPFTTVIFCSLGDAQAMRQAPITFLRQVLAGCSFPNTCCNFPRDVKNRVQDMLSACNGGTVGAYSPTEGIGLIRKHIANFITNRDGYSSRVEDIFLTTGASEGIKILLSMLNTCQKGNRRTGVMIPIPQYPMYLNTLSHYNMVPIKYYLNEECDWSFDYTTLKTALAEARESCIPRALVVINPGNPTGQVLKKEDIQSIIKFAWDERLVIIADEVYQYNVYAPGCDFHSFKRVMNEMGPPHNKMELASLFSISKGFTGECGFRGGYCELVNFDDDVMKQVRTLCAIGVSASPVSQIMVDAVVNPPTPGDDSYELYESEKLAVLNGLSNKAILIYNELNKMENISCNVIQGSMYAFARLHFSEKVIQEAARRDQYPDEFYCFQLLEETGVCVLPGSGFGQKTGTYHFRTTILPQEILMVEFLARLRTFNNRFMEKYS